MSTAHEKMISIMRWCGEAFNEASMEKAMSEGDEAMQALSSVIKPGAEFSFADNVTLKLSTPAAILLYHYALIGHEFWEEEVAKEAGNANGP